MQLHRPADSSSEHGAKGWYVGSWNGTFPFPVGYARTGIDDPHVHTRVVEVFLVARGQAELRVERETVTIRAGDMVVLDPGEAHTFLSSSPDFFHFVFHYPGLTCQEEIRGERQAVSRERLGLD
jgi:quercetin dioxygenase-like cupin family protein